MPSFPSTELATLTVGSISYPSWTKLRVNFMYGRSYAEFQFETSEPSDVSVSELRRVQIWPGMQAIVTLAGVPVINGTVEIRESFYGKEEHGVAFYGRDWSKNACDCSVRLGDEGGQYINQTMSSIMQSVLQGTGVSWSGPGDTGVVFPYFSVQLGETPWEIAERLMRYQPGMRIRSDGFGTLIGENANALSFRGTFVEGQNIRESRARIDITRSMASVESSGQQPHNDSVSSSGAANVKGHANDGTVDGRRYHMFVAEEPVTQQLADNRAHFELGYVRQEVIEVTVKVYGWFDPSGALFDVGKVYSVYSPMHGLNRNLYSREVTFEQDHEGTTTTVVLCTPESLTGPLTAGAPLPGTLPQNAVQTNNPSSGPDPIDPNNTFFGQGVSQSLFNSQSPTPLASSGLPSTTVT